MRNFQMLIVFVVKICKTVSANCFSFWATKTLYRGPLGDLDAPVPLNYSPH